MESDILYERDLLYPTENVYEPGCVHIKMLKPNKSARMPVIIESKTEHSPVKYIDSIIRILQSDVLDRIFVDIKRNVNLYVLSEEKNCSKFAGKQYLKVNFCGDKIDFEGVDGIDF